MTPRSYPASGQLAIFLQCPRQECAPNFRGTAANRPMLLCHITQSDLMSLNSPDGILRQDLRWSL